MPSRRLASALIWISPLISFGWLATGCQTAPADRPTALRSDQLVVGMQSDQIKELLGEPASIVPGAGDNYVEETWTYQIDHPPVYRTIVAEMRSVPWVDPITGEMKTIQEPINDQQRLDRHEKVRLLIRYGQLIRVDREVEEQRAFSR